jgi:hypothetical protein
VAQPAPKNLIANPKTGIVTVEWLNWLQALADKTDQLDRATTPTPPGTPPVTDQGASTVIVNNYGTGTPSVITKWTAPQSLGDSIMSETDATVTVHGTLIATTLQGRLDGVTFPAHAPTHAAVGTDPVTVTQLAGYPGGTATFLRADGAFAPASGATVFFLFDWSTATVEPPTSNQVRFDAGPPYTAVTKVWVRNLTTDGIDVHTYLLLVAAGATIYLQDKNDATLYARFTSTAPAVDKTTYVEIPVTWHSNGGALLNNQAVQLLVVTGSAGVAPTLVVREIPTALIDGSNTAFTLANTPVSDTEQVFLNGLLQDARGLDYSISGASVTFFMPPLSGDRVLVTYQRT